MALLASIGHCVRLARAGYVLAREGVFARVEVADVPPAARLPLALAKLIARRGAHAAASRLATAIARLGPSYVKLGQFLATRPDIVGPAVVAELELLQDRMAPFPRAVAVEVIEAAFGRKLADVFAFLGEPVAAASIAQVHKARVRDSAGERDVAVKVLRPGIERRFRRDLSDMYFAARWAERLAQDARRLKPVEVVDTLARTVKIEMDFRLEAAAASEFAENTGEDSDFRVPQIDWEHVTKDVLTLEWVDGVALSDLDALRSAGYDLPALARKVIQSFLRHALRDGFFHADMHQGNLFVDREGRLAAVDFGIMGRLGTKERRFLAEILYGFIVRDYRRVAEVHFEAGYVPPIHRVGDFAQALRAIGEPIHSRTADQISMAKLLTLLFEITALFDMTTRLELLLLQKTMVVAEGVGRRLDPRLDIWSTAEPVVRDWIERNLGPTGRLQDAARGLATVARIATSLPEMLERAERIAINLEDALTTGHDLSPAAIEGIARAEARRAFWSTLALWAIAAMLALLVFGL
ncbi:MAG: 2-polyprenylphenol 6-hydroxylase [Methylobacteriaceae bacterium]|nr:2-polyprenylphenol 6-hydroxylase [Methylobacteriaceae bacterium]